MSMLDQIIYDGLASQREKDAREKAKREQEAAEELVRDVVHFKVIIKLLLGLDVETDKPQAEIDGYTIGLTEWGTTWTHLYIQKEGTDSSEFGVSTNYTPSTQTVTLENVTNSLSGLEYAKEDVDHEYERLIAPPATAPQVAAPVIAPELPAEVQKTIADLREIILLLETGHALMPLEQFIVSTISFALSLDCADE